MLLQNHQESSIVLTMEELYDVLEVSREATYEEIKQSFQKLALASHPDKSSDPRAAETFRQIHAAWKVLGNSESRAAYDETLAAEDHIGANAEEVLLSDFSQNGNMFSKQCRCGSSYEVEKDTLSSTTLRSYTYFCTFLVIMLLDITGGPGRGLPVGAVLRLLPHAQCCPLNCRELCTEQRTLIVIMYY